MMMGRWEIEVIHFNTFIIGKDLLYKWCDDTSYMCNGSLYKCYLVINNISYSAVQINLVTNPGSIFDNWYDFRSHLNTIYDECTIT